ncbi:ectoine/hydroxyectoine ABC transporter substrate-binding protein EhuB [Mesorhizobium erdmanii]|uniref:ectoine/hydroxyectoine ABC transporter substrate-binding protein EhuB n=1 Tax=Mesorhizobium erdmanii TaxID=1777866 RepID=UPI0004157B9F|nr:ectoine/hydroxyectoine ABC transporter substrate-binding protein EhuB [Mesorhizobium erdmanii]
MESAKCSRTSSPRSAAGIFFKTLVAAGIAAAAVVANAFPASAQSLLEKIKKGEPVRIGFSNELPWAYPGKNGEPLGFMNAITIDVLKKLGTAKVEPILTEWGSLVPGLQAGRFDVITGGMYITPERCRNVLFTEPLGTFSDALVVPKGNPEGLHSYKDILDKGLTLVIATGSVFVKQAIDAGIPDDRTMQVAGNPEVVQAVKSGRASAGSGSYFTLKESVDMDPALELAEPFEAPGGRAYPGLALLPSQQADVDAFNAALKAYMGTEQMMKAVSKYGYTKINLPDGTKTADLCKS